MDFKCSKCENCYSSKMSLSNHKRLMHGNPKLYPCTQCEYISKCKQNCKMHIRAIHDKIKELCKVCGKQYSSKNNLHRHKKNIHLNKKEKMNPVSPEQSK